MARKQLGAAASGATDAVTLGQVVRTVTVVTGSETRPTTTAAVLWIGGTTSPTNLVAGDIWLSTAALTPVPSSVFRFNMSSTVVPGWYNNWNTMMTDVEAIPDVTISSVTRSAPKQIIVGWPAEATTPSSTLYTLPSGTWDFTGVTIEGDPRLVVGEIYPRLTFGNGANFTMDSSLGTLGFKNIEIINERTTNPTAIEFTTLSLEGYIKLGSASGATAPWLLADGDWPTIAITMKDVTTTNALGAYVGAAFFRFNRGAAEGTTDYEVYLELTAHGETANNIMSPANAFSFGTGALAVTSTQYISTTPTFHRDASVDFPGALAYDYNRQASALGVTVDYTHPVDGLVTSTVQEAIQALFDAGSSGGVGGAPVFIQTTEPSVTGPAVWYQVDGSGNVIDIKVQGS